MASTSCCNGHIAPVDQRRIEPGLGAVIALIVVAEGAGVATAVLVIALVGNNKQEILHAAGLQVRIQTARAVEANAVFQAAKDR